MIVSLRLFFLGILFYSCNNFKYVVKNQKHDDHTISISYLKPFGRETSNQLMLARIDSSNSLFVYMFYTDRIIKQAKKEKSVINYTVVFDNRYTSKISPFDTMIFKKVTDISDSLGLPIFRSTNATGFIADTFYFK